MFDGFHEETFIASQFCSTPDLYIMVRNGLFLILIYSDDPNDFSKNDLRIFQG